VETAGFNELLQNMAQQDFFTGIFPFILSYVVFYLALSKTPLFKEQEGKRFSAIVSVIFAFFVSYWLVLNPAYQSFFASYLSRIVIGIVGLLGLLVFLAFVPGFNLGRVRTNGLIVLVVLGAISAFAISGGGSAFIPFDTQILGMEYSLGQLIDYVFDSGLIYLLIIGGALYWVTKPESSIDWGQKSKEAAVWPFKQPSNGGNE